MCENKLLERYLIVMLSDDAIQYINFFPYVVWATECECSAMEQRAEAMVEFILMTVFFIWTFSIVVEFK